jgi:hypothetical protein
VQRCVITNGDEYRIYNAHAPVAVTEKLFRRVCISGSESEDLAETLLLLSKEQMRGSVLDEAWKPHFVDCRVRRAVQGVLADRRCGPRPHYPEEKPGFVGSQRSRLVEAPEFGSTIPQPPFGAWR